VVASLLPIRDEDLEECCQFLRDNLNPRISLEDWLASFRYQWRGGKPNTGFMLREEDRIVGVYMAIYSVRTIGGKTHSFCNLAAWSVLPAFRVHSLKLLKAILSQDGYHFTELSPNPKVFQIMQRFDFRPLDTRLTVILNLPLPTWRRGIQVLHDPERMVEALGEEDRHVFEDHRRFEAGYHLAVGSTAGYSYVIYRRVRRRGIPCAWILHFSRGASFSEVLGALTRYLLFRTGALLTLVESRFLAKRPPLSITVEAAQKKLYRSPHLKPDQIDNLYSEMVTLPLPTNM